MKNDLAIIMGLITLIHNENMVLLKSVLGKNGSEIIEYYDKKFIEVLKTDFFKE